MKGFGPGVFETPCPIAAMHSVSSMRCRSMTPCGWFTPSRRNRLGASRPRNTRST
jgi:hypothetical protein